MELRADVRGNVILTASSDAPSEYLLPYHSWGYYGSRSAPSDPLRTATLSPLEAHYLHAVAGKLRSPLPALTQQAVASDRRRYIVYSSLRDNGWVVREGGQFGGDFLLYRGAPGGDEHAPYVVLVVPENGMKWCVVAGLVRAAGGARKQLVLALPEEGKFHVLKRWVPEHERMHEHASSPSGDHANTHVS